MDWKDRLKKEKWVEGRLIYFLPSSYRHRVVVVCYELGRQKAEFSNGTLNYGAYVELCRPDGTWIREGVNVVPVLPDGRIVMVVEQRPAQFAYGDCPSQIETEGHKAMDLEKFGPYSSLEFPGGGVDADQNFHAAFLAELIGETGLEDQTATLITREPYFYPAGADVALRSKQAVIYLTGMKFEGYVNDDGGLHVLALSPYDILRNIRTGALASSQTVLLPWYFYQELQNSDTSALEKTGYISRKEVKIKK